MATIVERSVWLGDNRNWRWRIVDDGGAAISGRSPTEEEAIAEALRWKSDGAATQPGLRAFAREVTHGQAQP